MRKPNPTIVKTQIRHRSFSIYEQFKAWVLDNQTYIIHKVIPKQSAEEFAEATAINFAMKFKEKANRCENDHLSMYYNEGMYPHYSVAYMEYFEDEEGQPGFYSTMREEFEVEDLYKALECFMQRWSSEYPYKASTIKGSRRNRVFNSPYLYPEKPAVRMNYLFNPGQVQAMADAVRYITKNHGIDAALKFPFRVVQMVNVSTKLHRDCGRCSSDHAVKASGELVQSMMLDNLIPIFKDGAVISPSYTDPSVLRERVLSSKHHVVRPDCGDVQLVGYTGNKDKHGFGSLDHISW